MSPKPQSSIRHHWQMSRLYYTVHIQLTKQLSTRNIYARCTPSLSHYASFFSCSIRLSSSATRSLRPSPLRELIPLLTTPLLIALASLS